MPEEQVVSQETETIDNYMKILGFGKVTDFTPESVLSLFELTHWVFTENEELEKIPVAIEAKNKLLQHLVTEQLKVRRYFQITSPFENSCIHCKGAGELYKFVRKSVDVNCHICGGKGDLKIQCPECKGKSDKPMIQCPTCKGSGRYVRRWVEGGGINVTCRRCKETGEIVNEKANVCEKCNGEKTVIVKCKKCLGHGQIKKMVLDHNLKSTTPCPICEELGFTKNVKPKKLPKPKRYEPSNPVIPRDLAGAIRAHIKQ